MLVLIVSVLAGLLLVHFSEGKSSGAIVAMTAKSRNVPVIFCCETYKV